MIKNVIFDLGNVILMDKPSSIVKDLNISEADKSIVLNEFFNDELCNLDFGYISLKSYYDNCNLSDDLKNKIGDILLNYFRYREINDKVYNLMVKLKKNNYNIYILSNNNNETYEFLRELDEFKFIDGWIVSSVYHVVKPEDELYKILFEQFKLIPAECFFIDDKVDNIETGMKFGMAGHVLNYSEFGVDKLIEDMKKYDILI